jgi:predicted ester cyclase
LKRTGNWQYKSGNRKTNPQKGVHAEFRAAFPDIACPVEDSIAEGDKVMVRTTCRGTHKGVFAGVPPTGKQVTMPGMVIYRIADGKVVDRWGLFDDLGLMMQVGAIPAPPAPQ